MLRIIQHLGIFQCWVLSKEVHEANGLAGILPAGGGRCLNVLPQQQVYISRFVGIESTVDEKQIYIHRAS